MTLKRLYLVLNLMAIENKRIYPELIIALKNNDVKSIWQTYAGKSFYLPKIQECKKYDLLLLLFEKMNASNFDIRKFIVDNKIKRGQVRFIKAKLGKISLYKLHLLFNPMINTQKSNEILKILQGYGTEEWKQLNV